MLSIGKLAAGLARYYLDQAEARVDTVQSVGDALEDYHVAGTEARGGWLGRGAAELGLEGAVSGDELRTVLAGRRADDGAAPRDPSSRVRVAAFDLTLSALKSVSVVFGVGDDQMRDAVRAAHDVAVREAFAYVERSARSCGADRAGSSCSRPAGSSPRRFGIALRGPVIRSSTAMFSSQTSRGERTGGGRLAMGGASTRVRAARFINQAVLRGELSRSLGVERTPVEHGIAESVGVPRSVVRGFSRRRAETERAMAERGTDGARATEAAALASRRPKDRRQSAEQLSAALERLRNGG